GYDDVLEIGPGMGVLTKYLLPKKAKVTVMELDRESVAYLNDTFPLDNIKLDTSSEHFSIIEGDFLKKSIQNIFNKKQVAIIGNFPYNISTQIVFKAIENREYVAEFAGMFQKEVAKRIAEKEGSKVYGILSVLTQAFFDVEYLFTVPPTVFNPPPKVDSGVIRLVRKKDFSLPVDEKLFFRVVKAAFNQRRKMLRSSLKSFNLSDSLKEEHFFTKRPEQLSVNEFIELTKKLAENGI
uniref:16S rRNA (adenine(1518)-N(6)/adenine(1519)-N(6))- dimethyltransferase RsmA n=1 Tax=uncultured Polaribacter sp. TaxID=174711 RepID=UPI00262BE842